MNRPALGFLLQGTSVLSSIVLSMLLLDCAGQIEPGGGPVDTVPPQVLRTDPDSAATRVTAPSVELEFSKYVDRLSVQQSIFVSPYPGQLEYDWSGKSVRITFSDSLRKNTTYVVNVGTDVKDLHAGNRMAHGFTLAFSTGDSIDKGSISGRVIDDRAEGVMLFAYRLDGMNPDTLDPTHTKPDYIQQTGKDGTFELSHLSFGTYRVLAVRDEYRNLVYDRQVDEFGVWRTDLTLSGLHPSTTDLRYRLTKEDTTRPFLTSARNVGRRTILVHVSEPADTASFSEVRFRLVDTLTRKPVSLDSWYIDADQSANIGITTSAPIDSGRAYRLFAVGLRDLAQNLIDSARGSVDFVGTAEPDTVHPMLRVSIADSARTIPVDSAIVLNFSKRPEVSPLASAVQFFDSSDARVPFKLIWRGGLSLALLPSHDLSPAAWYSLSVVLDSVRDLAGNGYKDSTLVRRFRTNDYRSTGSLEGIVKSDTTVRSPIYVTASTIEVTPELRRTVRVNRPGPFSMDRLPEGRWTVSGFVDVKGTAAYDYGQPFPFKPAAPFGVSPDTVKVRARWGVQGVMLDLR
ncbi:MAG TPA: Ig-like domain-containing protein [Bacteroidota bacterium]|nr:Ig-like domain-containing protein [Bacteroidota bacterium]